MQLKMKRFNFLKLSALAAVSCMAIFACKEVVEVPEPEPKPEPEPQDKDAG